MDPKDVHMLNIVFYYCNVDGIWFKIIAHWNKAKIEITGTINIGWVNCNVIYLPYGLKLLCPIMDDVLIFFYNKLPVQAP